MNSIATKATICAVAGFTLGTALLYGFLGAPASADGASEALGTLLGLTGIAAILTHWMAKKAATVWSWPKFLLIYALTVVALLALSAYGRAQHGRL